MCLGSPLKGNETNRPRKPGKARQRPREQGGWWWEGTYLDQKAAVTLLGDHDHRVMQLLVKVDMALGAFCIMACCKTDTPDSGLVAWEEKEERAPGAAGFLYPQETTPPCHPMPPHPLQLPLTSLSSHWVGSFQG